MAVRVFRRLPRPAAPAGYTEYPALQPTAA
ncbi:hypothetical protein P3T27_005162 [Kitasatospora sp. MAA19]|nr:hypothetical protein [Kitasatospora sp. MAA19]